MPDRVFRGFRHPPTVWDRATVHMPEIGIAFIGIVRGVLGLAGNRLPFINPAVDSLPTILSVPTSGFLIVGGLLWISATLKRFLVANTYWYTLRWGLALCGFGWIGYFVAGSILRPTAAYSWFSALVFCLISWSLFALSFYNETMVRKRR